MNFSLKDSAKPPPLLTVENLSVRYALERASVDAVTAVSFEIPRGKTLALVGESGCGKTTVGLAILRLIGPPGRMTAGTITFQDQIGQHVISNMTDDGKAIRRIRGNRMALVPQEPLSALSPVHTAGAQIVEPLRLHRRLGRSEARAEALQVMERVGIPNPAVCFKRLPHELSGGLRQRVLLAMALICRPALLIADEPASALDVTLQAQMIDLLKDLQDELQMAILLITHDLAVVAEMADEVAVMYRGRIIERASSPELFSNPLHPYSRGLLSAIPNLDGPRRKHLPTIPGAVPDPAETLPGCPFAPRCNEFVAGLCDTGSHPPLKETAAGHANACLLRHEREPP